MGISDRRLDARASMPGKAELQWSDTTQQTIRMVGDLADLSQSGARVHLNRPVPVNTSVRMAMVNQERNGKVRYCVKQIRGYAIGVQFNSR
jgi:hypothetical protein